MSFWYFLFLIGYPAAVFGFLYFANNKGWLSLNHGNLFKQKLFWLAIAVPFVTFISFGAWVWWGKCPVLSAHGFERFLIISKLPLLFLAASVPLTSIVNNIHRTIQTEKQIIEAENKSKLDSYYSHIKFYTDYFKSLPESTLSRVIEEKHNEKIIKISYPTGLYKNLYPSSNPNNGVEYTTNRNHTALILKSWIQINLHFNTLAKINKLADANQPIPVDEILQCWYDLEMELRKICSYFGIIFPTYKKSKYIKDTHTTLVTSFFDIKEMYEFAEALSNISVGIVDSIGDLTMTEEQVLSKSYELSSDSRDASSLDGIVTGTCRMFVIEYNPPIIQIKP
ncbi:hypothetical protein ACM615_13530 [Rahnella sp. PAMC25617]|uniref:hypothetical protein n=1 Tax=Rahnella sp. PAMC25617 TaxID=3399684 RepID=UPI003D35FC91